MSLTKQHLGKHNDYECHSKVKKDAKRQSMKNLRNKLKRLLKKDKE